MGGYRQKNSLPTTRSLFMTNTKVNRPMQNNRTYKISQLRDCLVTTVSLRDAWLSNSFALSIYSSCRHTAPDSPMLNEQAPAMLLPNWPPCQLLTRCNTQRLGCPACLSTVSSRHTYQLVDFRPLQLAFIIDGISQLQGQSDRVPGLVSERKPHAWCHLLVFLHVSMLQLLVRCRNCAGSGCLACCCLDEAGANMPCSCHMVSAHTCLTLATSPRRAANCES